MINCENDVNWVENLPEYKNIQRIATQVTWLSNTIWSIFWSHSNRPRNKLFLAEKRDFEVPEENVDDANYDNPTELEEELNNLAIERDVLRKKALNASNNAARKMVKRELKRQPPSLYYKGDAVLVRIPISKKSVKGKKKFVIKQPWRSHHWRRSQSSQI